MSIASLLAKTLGKARDNRIVQSFTYGRTGFPHRSQHSDVRHIHRWFQSWVYICTERNGTAVSQQNMCLYHRSGNTPRATKALTNERKKYLKSVVPRHYTDDASEVEQHPFLDLLCQPNPILDQNGLLWLTAASLMLMGDAYWHVSFDGDGMPNELWPLPAQLMFPLLGPDKVYDRYELRIGGFIQSFEASEVIHFRKPSIIDTISGFGNLRGIIEAAETNTKMLEFERAIFENMAVPDLLLIPQGETTPAQVEALNQSWMEQFRGWLQRGKVATSPVDLKVEKIGLNMKELQHKETKLQVREEIAAGFGIPLPILTVDGTTFNNMFNGIQLWMRFTILPLCNKITDTINTSLMPFYSPRDKLESLDGCPERQEFFVVFDNPVPEDEDAKILHAEAKVRSGLYSVNEVRADEWGDDPSSWGEEPWIADGLSQPSSREAQIDFDRGLQEAESASAIDAAGAPIEAAPPTLSELTQAMSMFKDGNDVDGYNTIRAALADRFGVTIPPIKSISPSQSVGVVEPDDAEDRPGAEDAARQSSVAAEGEVGPSGSGGDRGKEKEKKKGKSAEKTKREDEATKTPEQVRRLVLAKSRAESMYGDADDDALLVKLPVAVVEGEEKSSGMEGVLDVLFVEMRQDVIARLGENAQTIDAFKGLVPQVVKGDQLVSARKDLEVDIVSVVFRKDYWKGEFADRTRPYLEIAFKKGSVLGELDLRGHIDVVEKITGEQIKQAATFLADDFASSVIDTTGDQIATIIGKAIDSGQGQNFMASEIAKLQDKQTDSHSLTVARTELNNALSAGAADTWKRNGVKQHEWLTSPDGCEFCEALDGKIVRIGEAFVKRGGVVRGVKGGTMKVTYKTIKYPTLHPRCRCTLLPVV